MNSFNNSTRITLTGTEITIIFSMLFLTGCIAIGTRSTAPEDITATTCRALYQEVDAAIDNANVRDHGSSLVKGFLTFARHVY